MNKCFAETIQIVFFAFYFPYSYILFKLIESFGTNFKLKNSACVTNVKNLWKKKADFIAIIILR